MARRKQNAKIARLRREGYKIWRIVELTGLTENDVMEALVDTKFYPSEATEMIVKNARLRERKPQPETTRRRVNEMRATRIRTNQARRKQISR